MFIKTADIDDKELSIYNALNENQLRRYNEPGPGLFVCESEKVIRRAFDAGYEPVSVLTSWDDTDRIGEVFGGTADFPIYLADEEVIRTIGGFALTDGLLCAMRRKTLPGIEEIISGRNGIAVLEDIENPTNVGAIFRSAAALGVEAVLLTYGSSDPLYRRSARVSMGTVFQIPWTMCGGEVDVIAILKGAGFTTIAMALTDNAVSVGDSRIKAAPRKAVILGNEGYGLRPDTISGCDIVAKIPMSPGVDSLNVAAASAVVFWEISGHGPGGAT